MIDFNSLTVEEIITIYRIDRELPTSFKYVDYLLLGASYSTWLSLIDKKIIVAITSRLLSSAVTMDQVQINTRRISRRQIEKLHKLKALL